MNNPTTTNTTNGTTGTADMSSTGTAASVRERISEGRAKINDGIDSATNRIGEVVEGKANALANKTQELLTSVAHGGHYLQTHEPKDLGADIVAVIKRHPVLTLAVGAGFGMMLGRMFRRR